ncbi:unnamed protein product [Linum trigynum]|uniref:Uncharacterized protein n=1 Tax=Linum trigynum TaxID=586398 RepID=A0AAV2G8S7_9ROSI
MSRKAEIPLTVDLGRYLGVGAIHGRVTRDRYKDLILRIQKKLAPWKAKQLSMAARITVVKSVSSSIPIYPMHIELVPVNVCRSLDKINRDFIWGESDEKKRMHLVAWPKLTQPRLSGGLGIRPARPVNLSMLAKGGWRIINDRDSLWCQVMRDKYDKNKEHLEILQR